MLKAILNLFGYSTATVTDLEARLQALMDMKSALITTVETASADRMNTISLLTAEVAALHALKARI